jgi:CheY-like chemotaxis protein
METTKAHPLRVLLADDDEDDRTFFRDALKEINIDALLFAVQDGEELLKTLASGSVQLPHLVFLDLNMPGKGGKECLKEIRSLPHLNHTPVIIFSTSANYSDVEETFRNGANLYIQKPSGYTLMVKLLDKVFKIPWKDHMNNSDRSVFLLS